MPYRSLDKHKAQPPISLIIIALIIIGRLHLFIRFKSYITVILSAIPASDYIFIGLVRFPFLFQPCLFIDLEMASRKQGLLRNRAGRSSSRGWSSLTLAFLSLDSTRKHSLEWTKCFSRCWGRSQPYSVGSKHSCFEVLCWRTLERCLLLSI